MDDSQPVLPSLETKGMLCDPGDHFKGRFEVERKFHIDDLAMFEDKLRAMGATPFVLGNSEQDVFLDLDDKRLEANNQFHTLRQMQPSGRVLWIVKGPAKDECVAMDLPDYGKALAMLQALGFIERRTIRKKRNIYFIGNFHVTLDDVEGLGHFVEIAAMTDDEQALAGIRSDLALVAKEIGLLECREEMRSYREMLFG